MCRDVTCCHATGALPWRSAMTSRASVLEGSGGGGVVVGAGGGVVGDVTVVVTSLPQGQLQGAQFERSSETARRHTQPQRQQQQQQQRVRLGAAETETRNEETGQFDGEESIKLRVPTTTRFVSRSGRGGKKKSAKTETKEERDVDVPVLDEPLVAEMDGDRGSTRLLVTKPAREKNQSY